jgi:ATP-dependent RNA helicase DDX3X
VATSFFNDKNRNIGQGLMDLLTESHQEVPSWLETIAYEGGRTGQNRRGGNRRFNTSFGSRDYRTQQRGGFAGNPVGNVGGIPRGGGVGFGGMGRGTDAIAYSTSWSNLPPYMHFWP